MLVKNEISQTVSNVAVFVFLYQPNHMRVMTDDQISSIINGFMGRTGADSRDQFEPGPRKSVATGESSTRCIATLPRSTNHDLRIRLFVDSASRRWLDSELPDSATRAFHMAVKLKIKDTREKSKVIFPIMARDAT